jgi:phosphoribosyl 1,2-cyclic phosphodiesterase
MSAKIRWGFPHAPTVKDSEVVRPDFSSPTISLGFTILNETHRHKGHPKVEYYGSMLENQIRHREERYNYYLSIGEIDLARQSSNPAR